MVLEKSAMHSVKSVRWIAGFRPLCLSLSSNPRFSFPLWQCSVVNHDDEQVQG